MYCKTILKGLSLFFLVCGLTAAAEGRTVSCLMRGTADNLFHEPKGSQGTHESKMFQESQETHEFRVSQESRESATAPEAPMTLHPQDSVTVHSHQALLPPLHTG